MAWSSKIQTIINQDFPPQNHPYRVLERTLLEHIDPEGTVLDIGCGRRAPNLIKLKGRAKRLIGIDIMDFEISEPDLILLNISVSEMSSIEANSVDLAYSRSVMEHLGKVDTAYSEIGRVLKPSGKYIFLTPNFWDYVSLISYVVPNSLHSKLVQLIEKRPERDTFPAYYRSNTYCGINRMSRNNGLSIHEFRYLGQYPSSFVFSDLLFGVAAKYEKFLERHKHLHFLRGWILCVLSKNRSLRDSLPATTA